MHYTGMAAMRMEPPIRYDPLLFSLSILIAVAASIVALWIANHLRSETIVSAFWRKAGSALVMARGLKLGVIAEGVETGEQLAFLTNLNCDEYQGYYFSRPVPAEDFARLLQASLDTVSA